MIHSHHNGPPLMFWIAFMISVLVSAGVLYYVWRRDKR